MITARQIRAARAFLGWSQQELADKAKLARTTIQRIEKGQDAQWSAIISISEAFEKAGVEMTKVEGLKISKV